MSHIRIQSRFRWNNQNIQPFQPAKSVIFAQWYYRRGYLGHTLNVKPPLLKLINQLKWLFLLFYFVIFTSQLFKIMHSVRMLWTIFVILRSNSKTVTTAVLLFDINFIWKFKYFFFSLGRFYPVWLTHRLALELLIRWHALGDDSDPTVKRIALTGLIYDAVKADLKIFRKEICNLLSIWYQVI